MPIKIPETLPAKATLERENIFVIPEQRALRQDIRPLKLLILNLMPTKIATETQLLRYLSNSPLQVEIDLMQTATYTPRNTPASHLLAHYTTFDAVRASKYDGMVITGAPVESLPFEEVDYWPELCDIMDWARSNVFSVLHICWGAQAGLYRYYGIQKYALEKKISGVFEHELLDKRYPLVRGFDDVFQAPHSRRTYIRESDIADHPDLVLLARSDAAGVYLIVSRDGRRVFVTGHSEYDADTLKQEYERDISQGIPAELPCNYFPGDDPARSPRKTWRSHGHLLYSNWLNYYVYQATPYCLENI